MLDAEFDRSGGSWQPGSGVCTLRSVGGKLAHACAANGITIEHEHRALTDARATAQLFAKKVLRTGLTATPVRVESTSKKLARTLRREAFSDRPKWMGVEHAVSRWADAIDHRRYPRDELGYVDLLDRALDDLWISAEEMVELGILAQLSGIAPERLPALHRLYLEDLYGAAIRDGVISDDEFRQLDAVAQALGFRLGELYPDFERYRPPPPASDVVGVGTRVAFTGAATDPRTGVKLERTELEAICSAAGLVPEESLKKSTTQLLVAADPNSASGKAKKARQWGIPIISVDEFVERFG
jgi:DNA polymerase-3 subunit epsilon